MKRLVLSAIAVLALAVPAMATATPRENSHTLKLSAPATVVSGTEFTLTGVFTGNHKVMIAAWNDQDEMVLKGKAVTAEGTFSFVVGDVLAPGEYTFVAWLKGHSKTTDSATVMVTEKVVSFIPAVPEVFLCYSTYQVEPGVWTMPIAKELFAAGYWQPFAVLGNLVGGTNLGAYHLVCNLATGQSVPDVHGYAGGSGEVYGKDLHDAYAPVLGVYPIVG